MSEDMRRALRRIRTLAFFLGGIFLGFWLIPVLCIRLLIPDDPPQDLVQRGCGQGALFVGMFALAFGAVVGLSAAGLLTAAIRRWGPLKVRREQEQTLQEPSTHS
jgi:hypothetical protein